MMILHYGEHLVVGGVCMTVNLEAEIFEGGLHEAGMIDRVFEIVLSELFEFLITKVIRLLA
ncbi:MAG: hypothetical protein QNK82_00220 [Akkermansiaceae bacterium]